MATTAQPQGRTLAELADLADVGDEAKGLLQPAHTPRDYLSTLVAAEQYPPAIRLLAHLMPKREAVWWGWYCAKRWAGAEPAAKLKAALDAAERWISAPNDEHRRAAFEAAEKAEMGNPVGCTGAAVFFSHGSLAPADLPPVPPDDYLTAKMVANAVTLAAVTPAPAQANEKFATYVKTGLDVANRISLFGKS